MHRVDIADKGMAEQGYYRESQKTVSKLLWTRPHMFLKVLGEIIEIFRHHFAELVGEIFQCPFLFKLHVLRAARVARDDEGVEPRRGVHGRRTDFAWIDGVGLLVRQVDESVDAVPELRTGGVVAHDVYRG